MQAAVTPEILAAAVAAADVGVLICDRALPDTPLVFVNDAFCTMTGYAREEVLGRNCRFLQGAGTDRAVAAGLRVAIAAGRPAEAELLNYRKDGRPFYNALRITPLADGSEPARYLIGVTQDVTDRVEATRALRQREALLAQTGRIACVGGWQLDLATMTPEWSDEVYRIHEVEPGERHALDSALDFYPPEARDLLEPTLARAIETGEPFDLELPFVTARGNRRWVRTMGEGEREDGRIVRLIGIFQDITERKRSELVLRESEARFRNMADHAPTVVWVTDAAGRPLYVSRRWYELTGQSPDAEHDWLGAVHPDDRQAAFQAAEAAWTARQAFRVEYRLCGPDGGCRWVVDAGAPRYAEDGVFLGYVGSVLDIEERRQAEERARELGARLDALSTAGVVGITVIEGERIVEANDAFLDMLGLTREDLAAGGLEWRRLTAAEVLDRNLVAIEEMIAAGSFRQFEKEYLHKDGSRVPVLLSAVVLNRGQRRWMCLIEDMSERKRAEAALRESEAKLRATQEHAGVGISEVDAEGRFLNVNPALCALVGYPREELLGRSVFDLTCADEVEADREAFRRVVAGEDQAYTMQKRYLRRDGSERWTEVTASAVRDAAGRFLYGVRMVQDIHDRRLAEAQVRHLAHHDPLTGLPNRTLLQDRLQQALLQARRHGEQVGLLLLDLDRFKDVNDTLGHDVGDALLREIAVRLRVCVRDTDTVARLGGDEFAIVLTRLRTAGTAAEIAGKILAALAEPVAHAEGWVHTGTSIGITLFPDDGEAVAQLLKNADIALYKAKAEHGGDYCFFEPRLRRQLERRQGLEHELRLALARGEIVPYFQPKVRLDGGRVVGFEALARWRHAERGLVLPGEFLRVAEDTGLITRLGETVLRQSVAAVRGWWDRRLAPGYVAVNVAGAQLRRRGFAAMVGEILAEAGLAPGRLVVEVTEGVFLGRGADGVATELEALHALGVTVALDDFGTGYASLSHLRRFPVGVLKVDQSFVRDMLADPGDAAIVRAVINLGHSFGMGVTAEGVETAEQADWLRLQGCDLGQGYLYGRPMPAEEVPAWLRARRAQPRLAAPLPD